MYGMRCAALAMYEILKTPSSGEPPVSHWNKPRLLHGLPTAENPPGEGAAALAER